MTVSNASAHANSAPAAAGPVTKARQRGHGPAIWLAGDPEDLKVWLPRGGYGIVTNTVVLNEMVQKYGPLTELVKRYLDITDKQVVVEVDGHTTQELLDVSHVFTRMSDQVIIKIPCAVHGLEAFSTLRPRALRRSAPRASRSAKRRPWRRPARRISCRFASR